MRHVIALAIKDLRISLRDRAATLGMLATPLLLAVILGMAFGAFGGSRSGLQVILVDGDGTQYGGGAITSVLTSADLSSLLTTTTATDPADARRRVDDGKATAAVIIPAGLGAAVTSSMGAGSAAGSGGASVTIEIYGNPTEPVGVGIVRTVVDGVLARMTSATAAARVTALSMVLAGIVPADDPRVPQAAQAAALQAAAGAGIGIVNGGSGESATDIQYGKIVGPSMAVLFLMFTVAAGARRMMEERDAGTLARLIVTPARRWEILAGKGAGIFLVGAVQMAILLVATTLIFGITWSSAPWLVAVTGAVIFAATAWGMLIAGFAKTAAQANQAGVAMTIVFGIVAGNFVPRQFLPDALKSVSLLTPNGLGLEGYQKLAGTGDPAAVAPIIGGLLVTGVVVAAIAVVGSRRQSAVA